jgi:hypothetical protein
MSRENVEVVRRVYEAVARRDAAAVLALNDPDVEVDGSRLPDTNVLNCAHVQGQIIRLLAKGGGDELHKRITQQLKEATQRTPAMLTGAVYGPVVVPPERIAADVGEILAAHRTGMLEVGGTIDPDGETRRRLLDSFAAGPEARNETDPDELLDTLLRTLRVHREAILILAARLEERLA